jgi:lipopolysaccharide transport system ATP-binding protein
MHLRLAFAVAAHLDPEILLVDEVLAVGDAAFQQKCLGKMGDVAKGGRTVLFVSHNMGAVARLCRRGVLLDEGRVVYSGIMSDTIAKYSERATSSHAEVTLAVDPAKNIQMSKIGMVDHRGLPSTDFDREHPFQVFIEYEVRQSIEGAHLAVMLDRIDGTPIIHSADIDGAPERIISRDAGRYRTVVEFPGGLFNAGTYQIRVGIGRYGGEIYDYSDGFVFHLHDNGSFATAGSGGHQRPGLLAMPLQWNSQRVAPQ